MGQSKYHRDIVSVSYFILDSFAGFVLAFVFVVAIERTSGMMHGLLAGLSVLCRFRVISGSLEVAFFPGLLLGCFLACDSTKSLPLLATARSCAWILV